MSLPHGTITGWFVRILVALALLFSLSGCLSLFNRDSRPNGVDRAVAGNATGSVRDGAGAAPEPLASGSDARTADAVAGFGAGANQGREGSPLVSAGDFSYENTTLTEDVTWRGIVLIRGWLVIAPQATVRIEPGTIVRLMKSPIMRQMPRLVVQGRIQCSGTPESPVLFSSNLADVAMGDWGGILLLSSAKRNQFEHVRIEGAVNGIEARYSTLEARGLAIAKTATAMLLADATATLSGMNVTGCDTGIESRDSEVEIRESSFDRNRRGVVGHDSTLVLLSVAVRESSGKGIRTERCRIRFGSCDFSANAGGADIGGGEGQIGGTRFSRNRDFGLRTSGARVRIQQSRFEDTTGDAIRMDDGRGLIWNCVFGGNSGFNLVNDGPEEICAVQNWWGSGQEAAVRAKLSGGRGRITIAPWLTEKPGMVP